MIWLYLKLIARNLWKNKLFTSINVLGIVIGFAVSALLLLYVKKETETNNFFPDHERIYRVENRGSNYFRNFSRKKVDVLRNHIPEIKYITKYHGSWSQQDLLNYNGQDYEVEDAFYADSVFFKIFQFETLYGDLENALDNPNTLVLTRPRAEKIFGNTNPVGKSVTIKTSGYGIFEYTITAVIEDIPNNCSFDFDAAFSLSGLNAISWYNNDANSWGTNNYTAFALLHKEIDQEALYEKMDQAYQEHAPKWVSDNMQSHLNPLNGLHFRVKYGDGVFTKSNKTTVTVLGIIGVLILMIACFNYFNLSASQLDDRIRTIGIKKVFGAKKWNLTVQSFLETTLLFALAFVVTLLVFVYVLPYFNRLTDSAFTLNGILSSTNLTFLILFFVFSLLVFALFPAIIIGNQKVVNLFYSSSKLKGSNHWFKNSLIIFQFVLAIMLIIGTVLLNKQYRYMLNSDYGFDTENIVYIPLSPESFKEKEFLEQEYEKYALTREVAFGSSIFGWIGSQWGRDLYYQGEKKNVSFDVLFVCQDFFELFDLEMMQGTTFKKSAPDNKDIIFNQSFVRKYDLSNPTDTRIGEDKNEGQVIGVVKDFHYNPMRQSIHPMGFVYQKDWTEILYVKLNKGSYADLKEALANFEHTWKKVSPNYPFEYHFMDDHFEEVYKNEMHLMQILTIASILTILIACLGLIGIAYYATNKRLKEIGIRKVNGAKVKEVIALLNKDLLVKVYVAVLIACPIAYIFIKKWLDNYAYKTGISWWIFVLAVVVVIAIASISISFISLHAARRNPVDVLRYE
jgi:putative ABC transport system permease protein